MTVPVLAVPVINRPDLLARCIASIDHAVARLVVIDNSPTGGMADVVDANVPDCVADWFVTEPPANLGVAASWNLAIRTHPDAPWWCIANADTEFGPGDLARLAQEIERPRQSVAGGRGAIGAEALETATSLPERWVGVNSDWRVFGLSRAAVRAVGLFDENFHPIYDEDADYERRCSLAGVPWYFIDGTSTHAGSAAIRSDERYARANARTHPANDAYYLAKWGGYPRNGERFTTPFDSGAPLSAWTLDIDRLRDQAW